MNINEQIKHLARNTQEIITRPELEQKLASGKKLVIKYGVDPTAPDIHLGHMVQLKALRRFQDYGHEITFLIGDFTGRIGDPSNQGHGRPAMSEQDVLDNAETYKAQVFKILNPDKTRIVYNSEWLKPLNLEDCMKLLGSSTVNKLIKRNSFVARFEKGDSIRGHELIYPFLQAYDSVALEADIELGGSDQYFNLIFGRDMQPAYGQEPQVVVTTPLLEGLDGNAKMSKSLGNTIGIDESANGMYAKLMTVHDELMSKYFTLLTDATYEKITEMEYALRKGEAHPMEIKHELARLVTNIFYDTKTVIAAREEFERVHQQGALPSELEETVIPYDETREGSVTGVELARYCGFASSNGEARRLISQGGLSIDDRVLREPYEPIELGEVNIVRKGKKNFAKVVMQKLYKE